MSKSLALELLVLFTAIGLVATFAAPWLELRGTYAAWRIVEWHTFWRGENAFQLASVVASDYRVPVEFATAAMRDTLRNVSWIGSALGAWHTFALIGLVGVSARRRLQTGASRTRVALEVVGLSVVNSLALYLLAMLLSLPSSLTPKVDFRSAADIHTDTLIWSSVNAFPVAPALAVVGAVGQVIAAATLRKRTR